MSNWEPEEVADADLEGIAGGAGDSKKTPGKKPVGKADGMSGGDAKGPTDTEIKGMDANKGQKGKFTGGK
ncbi:MAG TPA: hypothetical protein EYQ08_12790 [Planctomycetes bacterium]|nr:hypothetical protein [Planctomycetota bacterium]